MNIPHFNCSENNHWTKYQCSFGQFKMSDIKMDYQTNVRDYSSGVFSNKLSGMELKLSQKFSTFLHASYFFVSKLAKMHCFHPCWSELQVIGISNEASLFNGTLRFRNQVLNMFAPTHAIEIH